MNEDGIHTIRGGVSMSKWGACGRGWMTIHAQIRVHSPHSFLPLRTSTKNCRFSSVWTEFEPGSAGPVHSSMHPRKCGIKINLVLGKEMRIWCIWHFKRLNYMYCSCQNIVLRSCFLTSHKLASRFLGTPLCQTAIAHAIHDYGDHSESYWVSFRQGHQQIRKISWRLKGCLQMVVH
jgi:hypothetical protein